MNVRLSVEGAIGRIILARPPANLLDAPEFTDAATLEGFLAQPALKGAIVTGEGRHFSGGADPASLEASLADPEALGRSLAAGQRLLGVLSFATVPVVAAIRGQCLGAGFEIALACHFRVAASGSMVGFPEAGRGLLPGLGGTAPAFARPSRQALIDLLLSSRLVGADEALALGLVDRVAPTAGLDEAATRLLAELTDARWPEQVRAIMEAVHNGRRLERGAALRRETELFLHLARGRRDG